MLAAWKTCVKGKVEGPQSRKPLELKASPKPVHLDGSGNCIVPVMPRLSCNKMHVWQRYCTPISKLCRYEASSHTCLMCAPILGKLKKRDQRGRNRQGVIQHRCSAIRSMIVANPREMYPGDLEVSIGIVAIGWEPCSLRGLRQIRLHLSQRWKALRHPKSTYAPWLEVVPPTSNDGVMYSL